MMGSKRRLLLGLCLARDLLGTLLPERIQQRAEADPRVGVLAKQVRARLFGSSQGSFLDQFLFDLRGMERWRDRVQYALRHVLLFAWVNRALDPPSGLLRLPYRLLDRASGRHVWIWPLPLFALLSWFFHPFLPIGRAIGCGFGHSRSHTSRRNGQTKV